VRAIQVSYEAPDQDIPLVRPSSESWLHLAITRPSAFAAKRATNLQPIERLNPLYPENGLGSLRLRGKLNKKIMTYLSDIMRL
jgi:hypothetical protein